RPILTRRQRCGAIVGAPRPCRKGGPAIAYEIRSSVCSSPRHEPGDHPANGAVRVGRNRITVWAVNRAAVAHPAQNRRVMRRGRAFAVKFRPGIECDLISEEKTKSDGIGMVMVGACVLLVSVGGVERNPCIYVGISIPE